MKQMNQQNSSSFDPYSWKNFYFHVDREEANRLLCEDHNSTLGSFLIRDSTSPGSYALSVRFVLIFSFIIILFPVSYLYFLGLWSFF